MKGPWNLALVRETVKGERRLYPEVVRKGSKLTYLQRAPPREEVYVRKAG